MPVIMASSVGLISAVKVRLSLGHGHSIKGHLVGSLRSTEGGFKEQEWQAFQKLRLVLGSTISTIGGTTGD